MPRQREEDIDWYVQMSDRLERRERRRKWIALGICVSLPLVLMGGFLLYIVGDKYHVWDKLKDAVHSQRVEAPEPIKEAPVGPVSVESFHKGDIKFAQLDSQDLVTSITHYFRELLPEGASVFTVVRDTDEHGTVLIYRLRNVGTGETYEVPDVEARKVGDGWALTEEGWKKVRDDLQVKMRVRLAMPTL